MLTPATTVLLAELDATGWAAVITAAGIALTALATQIVGMVLAYLAEQNRIAREDRAALKADERDEKAAVKVEAVAVKVAEVAVKQEARAAVQEERAIVQAEKQDEGLKINRATHTLVNLKTSKQLTTIRDDKQALHRLLKTAASAKALEGAERDLAEHLTQQAKVDAEYGTETAKQMGTGGNSK